MIKYFFSYLLLAPFLASLVLLLWGSRLGPRGAVALTLLLVVGQGLCCAALLPLPLRGNGVLRLDYGPWFEVGSLRAHWAFLLDALSLPMASLVVGVSAVAQLYSYWYMAADPALVRFQAYLQLFTFCMLLLVFGDNFGVFFLG
jgi:NADH-quinone oxidoreductase subunit L